MKGNVRIPRIPEQIIRLRVKELAEERGVTIAELSYGTQISRQNLYKIWNSDTKAIELKTLGKIAYALNVDIGDLFEVSSESSNECNNVVESEGNKNPALITALNNQSARGYPKLQPVFAQPNNNEQSRVTHPASWKKAA